MFRDIGSMVEAVERFREVRDKESFENALYDLQNYMKRIELPPQKFFDLEKRAYYLSNGYSEKDTKERILEASQRVIDLINELMREEEVHTDLQQILDNFYLFLEALTEHPPHKKGTIKIEQLTCLKIGNEYDVQHLLYAYLKPLYPTARTEVNEDTGYGTVRTDIYLDPEHVIEIKCTRGNMSQKKLVEEIGADIIHYRSKNIYFFIYDKEKVIENPLVFKSTYENIVKEKNVLITIHQPKIL